MIRIMRFENTFIHWLDNEVSHTENGNFNRRNIGTEFKGNKYNSKLSTKRNYFDDSM